jgi:hypothetical protein
LPHSAQKRAAAGASLPQVAQRRDSAAPHSRQNLAPGGFSWLQAAQCIAAQRKP